MKSQLERRWTWFVIVGVIMALVAGMGSTLPSAYAAGMIEADQDKWISIGMGIRTSFSAIEGAAAGGSYSKNFRIDHQRLYFNGQIHKYIKFTVNTECYSCSQNIHNVPNSGIGLLDAIGKFEFNEKVNLWVGQTIVPNERRELSGPFGTATHNPFRTPFFPQDFRPAGGTDSPAGNAGLAGRDIGAVYYGKVHPFDTHLLYVASVFTGLRGGPSNNDNLTYAGRLQWNLLNDEDNPGYYTSGTYYGTAGDILAIAGSVQYQKNGAGSPTAGRSDFTGLSVDLLLEKLLPDNMGVFTFNTELKRFFANYGAAAAADPAGDCFCVFNGHSWSLLGLYLIPNEIGIGQFQPYVRYTSMDPEYSSMRTEWEFGINYVISGLDARIAAWYTYGDIDTKGNGNFTPNASGEKVNAFHAGLQLQY